MRIKSPRRQRHNKVLALTKGFKRSHSVRYGLAKDAALHAGQYAFAGRRLKKRDLRRTWIVRIKAALEDMNFKYSGFISALNKSKIALDRKILAELATNDINLFKKVVKSSGLK